MVVFETNVGNFGSPQDMLRYMEEEGSETISATAKICGEIVGKKGFELTIQDVKNWIDMGKEGYHDISEKGNEDHGAY